MAFKIQNGVLRKYTEENGVTDVVIPDSVTSIGDMAFYNCLNLTLINIPDGVAFIGNCAFSFCDSLTSITIPDSVTFICDSAFSFCEQIEHITIKSKSSSITINDKPMKNYADLEELKKIIDFIRNESEKKDTILDDLKELSYKIAVASYLIKKYDSESTKEFIKDNIEKIVKYYTDNNDAESLTYILSLCYVTKRNIDGMIKYAINNKKTEIQVILSNYKNDNFGFNDNFDKYML